MYRMIRFFGVNKIRQSKTKKNQFIQRGQAEANLDLITTNNKNIAKFITEAQSIRKTFVEHLR